MARPIAQAILLEKFRSTDWFAKTVKLFHLKQFAIYSIYMFILIRSKASSYYFMSQAQ